MNKTKRVVTLVLMLFLVSGIAAFAEDIYFVGGYQKRLDVHKYEYVACYWKNGVRHELRIPGVSNDDIYPAQAIAVSGGDIYVVGMYNNSENRKLAGYWKNGTWQELPAPNNVGNFYEEYSKILVQGSDVYVFGSFNKGGTTNFFPGYWKNGTWRNLPVHPRAYTTSINGVAVSGSDIYVSAFWGRNAAEYGSTYWKNGTRYDLGKFEDNIKSLAVSGSDLYFAGYFANRIDTYACYWKNNTRYTLPIPQNAWGSGAASIAVFGSDVYIAGTYQERDSDNNSVKKSCYWKNGTRIDLPMPPGARENEAFTITVSGSGSSLDIYIIGKADVKSKHQDFGYNWHAGYWKNGTWHTLSLPESIAMRWGQSRSMQGDSISNSFIYGVDFSRK